MISKRFLHPSIIGAEQISCYLHMKSCLVATIALFVYNTPRRRDASGSGIPLTDVMSRR